MIKMSNCLTAQFVSFSVLYVLLVLCEVYNTFQNRTKPINSSTTPEFWPAYIMFALLWRLHLCLFSVLTVFVSYREENPLSINRFSLSSCSMALEEWGCEDWAVLGLLLNTPARTGRLWGISVHCKNRGKTEKIR